MLKGEAWDLEIDMRSAFIKKTENSYKNLWYLARLVENLI